MKSCLAEAAGTFLLVFFGTGAIIFNDLNKGALTDLGISMVFGIAVMCIIIVFSKVSGAHINPAVTLGLAMIQKHKTSKMLCYIAFQLAGAIIASALLKLLFPDHKLLGLTVPIVGIYQSFLLEFLLTCVLMALILWLDYKGIKNRVWVGFIIGSMVFFAAYFAGPFCGASMNPARSIAPALVSGQVKHLWIYITAPLLGALCAAFAFKLKSRLL